MASASASAIAPASPPLSHHLKCGVQAAYPPVLNVSKSHRHRVLPLAVRHAASRRSGYLQGYQSQTGRGTVRVVADVDAGFQMGFRSFIRSEGCLDSVDLVLRHKLLRSDSLSLVAGFPRRNVLSPSAPSHCRYELVHCVFGRERARIRPEWTCLRSK